MHFKKKMKGRSLAILLLVAVLIAISASAVVYTYYQHINSSTLRSGDCGSILQNNSQYFEKGFSYACGIGVASDGRLNITIHNYHFAQRKDIQFQFASNQQNPQSNDVFLLVNVTVMNIGGGNTSIAPGFGAVLLNGTSYIGATQFIANASFPDTYPNQTIPNYQQAENIVYLPPGSKADLWLFFYIPFSQVAAGTINEANHNLKLQLLIYRELTYGGTFDGLAAGFNCQKVACEDTNTEFIIQTMNNSHS